MTYGEEQLRHSGYACIGRGYTLLIASRFSETVSSGIGMGIEAITEDAEKFGLGRE
jgi:hypothetical protein